MTAYKYCPLDVELQEIRLLKLLPGTFDDDIRCEMFHAPLREPANSEQLPKVTVQELQKTLPRGWEVYETIDGRFAFINRDAMVSTWTHPVPGFDPARYALTSWNLIPDYDPSMY
ncbi:hypothetical protein H2203_001684 [Taxawa tesnikishii (nom. ined.)]|nr:hypothetical protein H2203_001684 [Dothideales sp. JES 119]